MRPRTRDNVAKHRKKGAVLPRLQVIVSPVGRRSHGHGYGAGVQMLLLARARAGRPSVDDTGGGGGGGAGRGQCGILAMRCGVAGCTPAARGVAAPRIKHCSLYSQAATSKAVPCPAAAVPPRPAGAPLTTSLLAPGMSCAVGNRASSSASRWLRKSWAVSWPSRPSSSIST